MMNLVDGRGAADDVVRPPGLQLIDTRLRKVQREAKDVGSGGGVLQRGTVIAEAVGNGGECSLGNTAGKIIVEDLINRRRGGSAELGRCCVDLDAGATEQFGWVVELYGSDSQGCQDLFYGDGSRRCFRAKLGIPFGAQQCERASHLRAGH